MNDEKIDTSPDAVAKRVALLRALCAQSASQELLFDDVNASIMEAIAAGRDSLAAKLAEAERERDAALFSMFNAKHLQGEAGAAVKAAVEAEREACATILYANNQEKFARLIRARPSAPLVNGEGK